MSAPISLDVPRDEVPSILVDLLGQGSVALVGPPGTGKTSLALAAASMLGRPLYKVACHPDALATDVIGAYSPDPHGSGKWLFAPGPMLLAWGHGAEPGILLLDDCHLAGAGMQAALYTALDAGQGARVTLPTGQTVTPAAEYAAVVTLNGSADQLDPPVLDRLLAVIPVTMPSTDMLARLDDQVRALAAADYASDAGPRVSYREWYALGTIARARAVRADSDAPVALAQACLMALRGRADRARAVVAALAANGDSVAIQAAQRIAASLPSGGQ